MGTLLKVLEKLSALLLEHPTAVTATKSKVIKGILILCIISSPSKKNDLRAFILASARIVSTKLRASELPWLVDLILYVRTRSVLCQPYASEACGRSLDRANAELNWSKPHATAAQRH